MGGTVRTFIFTLYVIILPIVVVFGILGNLLSIIVLGRDRIQKSTSFLLRALAATDTVFLISCIPVTTLAAHFIEYETTYSLKSQIVWYEFFIYFNPLFHATQMASTWVLVLVTIERYILVCKPLHASKYMSIRCAGMAVALIWIGAIIFQIPLFFQTRCVWQSQHTNTNMSCTEFEKQSHDSNMTGSIEMGKNIHSPLYHLIYRTLGYILVRFVAPFTILIYLSARLAQDIRSSHRRHEEIYANVQNNDTQSSREGTGKYTRIVVTIATLFVICLLPGAILLLITTLKNYKIVTVSGSFSRSFDAVASLLLTVNSSCNFIIYCVMRASFRLHLRALFQRESNDHF